MPKSVRPVELFERMLRLRTLDEAWDRVRTNGGCAGGDGVTIRMFQPRAAKALSHLAHALREGSYRPGPLRIVHVDKDDGSTRPLAIPPVIDRIAHTACAAILNPILDPGFADASFGYRPGRGVLDAVRAVAEWRRRGFTWVVDADIVRCFERIPHEPLLDRLAGTLSRHGPADPLVDLIARWLDHAGDALGTPGIGLAQGSPLSPLLSNLYLDAVDDALERPGIRLVRYADDFVLLCETEARARAALDLAAGILAEHALELRSRKTRVVDFDRGFEFLGHLFVRSMALRQVADSAEDMVETLRAVAARDEADALEAAETEEADEALRVRGFDPGLRTLYLHSADRRLGIVNQSFAIHGDAGEGDRLLLTIPHGRVDRIEVAPGVTVDTEALRHALATETDIALIDGQGTTLGTLTPAHVDRAGLHLAQARIALDDGASADLARRLVTARLRTERALLKRLNRRRDLDRASEAALGLGRLLRKLPEQETVRQIMGIEGAAAALYWPALAELTEAPGLHGPFTRDRPANDPLDASINYLTALLGRDVRAAILRAGLHPGFGVLHRPRDYGEACVWDLMEPFRVPLCEAIAVGEFNRRRLDADDFTIRPDGVRIGRNACRRLVKAYEEAASRLTASPYGPRRRRWRALIVDAARAYGRHCVEGPDAAGFTAPEMGY